MTKRHSWTTDLTFLLQSDHTTIDDDISASLLARAKQEYKTRGKGVVLIDLFEHGQPRVDYVRLSDLARDHQGQVRHLVHGYNPDKEMVIFLIWLRDLEASLVTAARIVGPDDTRLKANQDYWDALTNNAADPNIIENGFLDLLDTVIRTYKESGRGVVAISVTEPKGDRDTRYFVESVFKNRPEHTWILESFGKYDPDKQLLMWVLRHDKPWRKYSSELYIGDAEGLHIIANEFARPWLARQSAKRWHEKMQARYLAEEQLADDTAKRGDFGKAIKIMRDEKRKIVNPRHEREYATFVRRLVKQQDERLRRRFGIPVEEVEPVEPEDVPF